MNINEESDCDKMDDGVSEVIPAKKKKRNDTSKNLILREFHRYFTILKVQSIKS